MFTYKILNEIGSGGFGKVYSAIQNETGGIVAIKFVADGHPDLKERLMREARILQRVRSPNIVGLIDCNFQAPRPFIVLEYCDQGSLEGWIRFPRPTHAVTAVLFWISNALSQLHAEGGFHRDIKPANILLHKSQNGLTPKLADFGLARTAVTISPGITRSPAGTVGYIAPELSHGVPFDACCDIYSLGVTATELLTGSRDILYLFNNRIPVLLRNLILAMRSIESRERPDASYAASVFAKVHDDLIAAEKKKGKEFTNTVLGLGILAGAALVLVNVFQDTEFD